MVELFEFTLIILSSAIFTAASLSFFTNYLNVQRSEASMASLSMLVSTAKVAVSTNTEQGIILYLRDVNISCIDGKFSISIGDTNYNTNLGVDCEFSYSKLNGLLHLRFIMQGDLLRMVVEK